MKSLKPRHAAPAATFAIIVLLSVVPSPGQTQPPPPKPAPGQLRPDLDEHDRWRDQNFPMDAALDLLGLKPGLMVAEIGAGWGYLSFKLAKRVAPDGVVLAEEIEPKRLAELMARAAARGLTNIKTVLGTETDPKLPAEALDMIFIHAVLQWVADRPSFLRTAGNSLKPNGCLVIIEPETEGDDPEINVAGPGRHPTRRGYLEIFRRAGFELVAVERKPDWKWPVFVIKRKPAPTGMKPRG